MKKMSKINYLDETRIKYIGKGVLVGACAGFIVSLFRLFIATLSTWVTDAYLFFHEKPLWLIPWILLSSIIAVFVGLLVKSEPDIKGSGIPQVEGQLRDEIHVPWFPALWKKFIGGVLSVGMGLFLGREGPSIQLGASVGQGFAKKWQAENSETKVLISSGASAGLAAAFNAPIAGLLFVVEEVHHNFSPLVWLTSFASAITANFVSLTIFGLQPVLHLGAIESLPLRYYWLLILLGIFLGLLGRFYQLVLLSLSKWFHKLPLPEYLHGLIPFLLVIPIGWFFPDSLGGGNQIVIQLGQTSPTLLIMLGLFLLRFVFSMISYGSSLPGGIFLPILTLGAVLGSLFGTAAVLWFHIDPIFVKNFIIVAMAGYFAAIGKAPLTAIVLVTEMVGSLVHLMPLGVVALVAYVVVDLLGGNPIYESLLERLVQTKPSDIQGKKLVLEWPITVESSLDGLMIRDFNWPANMLLISIRRGDHELLTHGDTIMKLGDTLRILTDDTNVAEVRQTIQQRSAKTLI
ncbi:ClC family H(+)/Cl(-) exchange transporter [Enterococcus massiliensis]|uniref:ClC family H(+)/Cl(-) exchange transporter n=1 Tax=Enterococcus massiliensis TaxID=1640685 RepID=UPI00164E4661|nr:ClC family H(+)/Cl(-) exchange transporter [Enterococcus massiliensis]